MIALVLKYSIGFIILIFVFSSSGIQTAIKTISLINAGHYMALPETMAWNCVDTIKSRHSKRIKRANELEIDPIIKRQMIDFERADYKRDLWESCDIADSTELPDRDKLMEVKP